MNEFKGTPGPWNKNKYGEAVDAQGEIIHLRGVALSNREVTKANTDLVIAAPELLEALQMALEWIDAVPSDTRLPAMPGFDRDEVNNVINKALGETK